MPYESDSVDAFSLIMPKVDFGPLLPIATSNLDLRGTHYASKIEGGLIATNYALLRFYSVSQVTDGAFSYVCTFPSSYRIT